jgi:hypothetical protein
VTSLGPRPDHPLPLDLACPSMACPSMAAGTAPDTIMFARIIPPSSYSAARRFGDGIQWTGSRRHLRP